MNYVRYDVATLPENGELYDSIRWWFFEAVNIFDPDGDGDKDIVIGMTGAIWDELSPLDPKPYVIENIGGTEFILGGISIADNQVKGWINNIVVGDFNSDGRDDAVLIDHGREDKPYSLRDFGELAVLESNSARLTMWDGRFEADSSWTLPDRDFWHGSVNTRDYNLDGHLDVVVSALGQANVELWTGDGSGNFNNVSQTLLSPTLDINALSFGISGFVDAGGDGIPDVFSLPYGLYDLNSNGFISINPESKLGLQTIDLGDLSKDLALVNNLNQGYSEAVVADFDNNGLEDIIALAESTSGNLEGQNYWMYLSQVAPFEFRDVTVEAFGSYSTLYGGVRPRGDGYENLYFNGAGTEFYTADYNGDGFLDLNLGFPFLGEWQELESTIFLNDGSGNFARAHKINLDFPTGNYPSLRSDGVGDLNEDGVADIFVIEQHSVGDEAYSTVSLLLSDPATLTDGVVHLSSDAIDKLLGTTFDDLFVSIGGGSDIFDGRDGMDTVRYTGDSDLYSINKSLDYTSVVKSPQYAATDQLISIERLQFSDTSVALDFAKGQSAYNSATLIGTAFGADYIDDYFGIGLSIFDIGSTVSDVAHLITQNNLIENLFGIDSNEDWVAHVYENVVGAAPDEAALALYTGYLDNGDFTKAELLALAQSVASIDEQVGIVGLQSTGLEYTPVG